MKGFNRQHYPNGVVIEMTPWAQRVITPTQQERIAYIWAAPFAPCEVHLGKGDGWTGKVLIGKRIVAEVFGQPDVVTAARVACEKARDLCPICHRRPGEVSVNLSGDIELVCDTCWERAQGELVADL